VPGKAHAVLHGVVTPAVRPGSSMSSNTHGTNKRQKLIDGGAHRIVEPSTGGRTPSGSNSALPRPAITLQVPMPSQSRNWQGYAALGWGRKPSCMPRSVSQPRVAGGHLGSSQYHTNPLRSYNSGSLVPNHYREPTAKSTTGRIRKGSLKPRPRGDDVGRGGGGWKTGLRGVVEEDEC